MARRSGRRSKMVGRKWGFVLWIVVFSIYVDFNLFQATPEGDALQIIKEMLHAEVNWTGNDPCVGWEGVHCSLNHVVSLNLSGKSLHGRLPPEIGQLSFLNSLDLSNNRIEENIPDEMANLKDLHTLSFRYNLLSGGFPQAILKLRKIVYLRLDNTHLSGSLPSDIQQLSSLEYLYLGNCSFTGRIPTGIQNLTNLKGLSIWGNNINSTLPVELSKLTNLEILNLHDAHMHGTLPPEFASLHKMRNLSLQANLFTGTIPESWSSMINIQQLNLFHNHLSGRFPTWISRFGTKIILGCNYFTGPKPIGIPENVYSFTGNCLDYDLDSHAKACLFSPSCVSFYSEPENAQSGYQLKHRKGNHTWVAIVASLSCILVLLIIIVGFYTLKMKKKQPVISEVVLVRMQSSTDAKASDADEPLEVLNGVRRFSLEEIVKATEGFSKVLEIGFGGFGKVYRGHLDNGCVVAVKRSSPSSIQGDKQFRNEIVLLSRLCHRCLVKLEGFCQESGEHILVYEFMKNGNLNTLILDEKRRWSLSWHKRIEIAAAIAHGLDYLHSFADPPIVHRDVKLSNILLDEHLNAKLSDFGISRSTPEFIDTHISTAPAGTIGYVDPQYFLRRHLAPSSDVYSFGVVFLELITGQKAIDHSRIEEYNLVEWVKLKLQGNSLETIIDPPLLHDSLRQDFSTTIELALKCTAFERYKRPSMKDVVQILDPLLKKCDAQKGKEKLIVEVFPSSTPSSQSSTSQAIFTGLETTLTGR